MVKRSYEEVLSLYQEYLEGTSLTALNKKYSTDTGYLFKKYELARRTSGETRQTLRTSKIQLAYSFEEISTADQAYICGLILADGYVGDSQIKLDLKIADIALLEKVRDFFSPEIEISTYNNRVASCKISSKVACTNAKNLGLISGKESTEVSIPRMDKNLYRHFIRGFFDGDGTIFKCYNKYLKSNICSPTRGILEEIQQIFKENGIDSTINQEIRNGQISIIRGRKVVAQKNMYRLFVRKKASLKKLYEFLYKDAHMFLSRKRKVFEDNFHMLKSLR